MTRLRYADLYGRPPYEDRCAPGPADEDRPEHRQVMRDMTGPQWDTTAPDNRAQQVQQRGDAAGG